jgi:maltooligosyltrehalose synthase
VIAVPLFPTGVFAADNAPLGRQGTWEDTALELPADSPASWSHVFTGETLPAHKTAAGKKYLYLRYLLLDFPVALLEGSSAASTNAAASLPLEQRLQ